MSKKENPVLIKIPKHLEESVIPLLKSSTVNKEQVLKGKYLIEKVLGYGGMGKIYKGFDLETGKLVAIKKLKLSNEIHKKRFEREYLFLKKVEHPYLVKAFDYFTVKNRTFIVLEFIEGHTLQNIIDHHKEFSLLEKISLAIKIARGVEVLNMGGIIHRDLKPANIIANEDNIKILDLGIGKDLFLENEELTLDNVIIGTRAYASPEQVNGIVSDRSDIFALGTIIYQLITWNSASPFLGKDEYETIRNVLYKTPLSLYQQMIYSHNKIDGDLQAYQKLSEIVEKAIEKRPKNRWESAGKIADYIIDIQKTLCSHMSDQQNKQISNIDIGLNEDLSKTIQSIKPKCQNEDIELTNSIELVQFKSKTKKSAPNKPKINSQVINSNNRTWYVLERVVIIVVIFFLLQSIFKIEKQNSKIISKLENLKNSSQPIKKGKSNLPKKLPKKEKHTQLKDVKNVLDAIKKDDTRAMYNLGNMYEQGFGVEQNHKKAFRYFLMAANRNYTPAFNKVGICYFEGKGAEKDYKEAFQWIHKAANKGNAQAMGNLGISYIKGLGIEQDYSKGREWVTKGILNNEPGSINNMGYIYEYGCGVEKNYEKAFQYFSKSAEMGYATAMANLAGLYRRGLGVGKNYKKAIEWYSKAAEQDHSSAMNHLGAFYSNGQGVSKNYMEAVKWFTRAAKLGNINAMGNLGNMYRRPEYSDYKKAAEWYRKAANLGSDSSMYNLGVMYEVGLGVPLNYKKATEWFKKAAKLGNIEAIKKIKKF